MVMEQLRLYLWLMNRTLIRFALISLLIATSMAVGAKLHFSILDKESTMQTFFLFLTALYFKPSEAVVGQIIYLVAGLFYPVFSGSHYGIDILTGDSAGFLAAFPIVAFLISKYGKSPNWFTSFSWTVVGHAIILLFAFVWLVYGRLYDTEKIYFSMLAYLPSAFIKSAVVATIYFIAEKLLKKT